MRIRYGANYGITDQLRIRGRLAFVCGTDPTAVESQNRGLPWLADLPYFGVPFRRVEETTNEVELLIMVTPEFIEAADPEELPPCGPGETTTSPNDCELYFRGYLEVPKCCEEGNCPQCQEHVPTHEVLGPEAGYPIPVPEADGGVQFAPSARRPGNAGAKPAAKSARRNTRAARGAVRQASHLRQPRMIGPVGYEPLK